jgi:Fe-S cluster assembly scaffold protein SufB
MLLLLNWLLKNNVKIFDSAKGGIQVMNSKGGIYNFVTKRGLCAGANSKISWTQVETGSSIT